MDLILEILSWLPVKSLVRFRCLSKSLKSLTSDPIFVKLHLERSQKNASPLFIMMNGSLKHCSALSRSVLENPSSTGNIVHDHAFNYTSHPYTVHFILGSYNGLICYVIHLFGTPSSFKKYLFYLWNPATWLISETSAPLVVYDLHVTKFGFGYDSLSDTYKVVAFIFKCNRGDISSAIEVKVCNIGDNCWRNIQLLPSFYISRHTQFDIHLRGTLNWLTYCPSRDSFQFLVASLDLAKETYRQFMLPRDDVGRYIVENELNLGILNDCFSFSYKYRDHFVVWQMKEYGIENSWTQLLRISNHHIPKNWLRTQGFPILRLTDNGGILIMSRFGKRAILYGQRDNKVEHIEISNDITYIYGFDYIPSLVSPC